MDRCELAVVGGAPPSAAAGAAAAAVPGGAVPARAGALRPPTTPRSSAATQVAAAEIREAVALGVPGPNQLKAFTRCGMGPCQGRMCGLPVAELLAAQQAVSSIELDSHRVRSPMKPVRLGELAGLAGVDDAATKSTEMPTSMDAASR